MTSLDAQLLAAHDAGDQRALIDLYREAADRTEDADACGFYLTQAFIYALEAGAPEVDGLRQRLIDMGRELPA
ncbi:hypothetical protein [uncultured Roseobacter sp.]|uniref:hypothetical protein n=1 Tax=uncultured Roseobacter sp. TaxID=114847 RepID=UPI00261CD64C|nr:hypothetical protein [uncultured Roseobacter sp.]